MDLEELKVMKELCKVGSITDVKYLDCVVEWIVCELEKKEDKKEEPKIDAEPEPEN